MSLVRNIQQVLCDWWYGERTVEVEGSSRSRQYQKTRELSQQVLGEAGPSYSQFARAVRASGGSYTFHVKDGDWFHLEGKITKFQVTERGKMLARVRTDTGKEKVFGVKIVAPPKPKTPEPIKLQYPW
ncbi:MAG: hypothetical protein AB7F31_07690 [Parachlamydiales bacterium]